MPTHDRRSGSPVRMGEVETVALWENRHRDLTRQGAADFRPRTRPKNV
jgi:hypothetical protein